MFTTAGSLANIPRLETRKALIVINLQNDSFHLDDEVFVCKNPDFIEGVKSLIPRFRDAGDIVWVRTEMHPRADIPAASSSTAEDLVNDGHAGRDGRRASTQTSHTEAGKSEEGKTGSEPAASEVTPQDADNERRLKHLESMEKRVSAHNDAGVQAASRSVMNHDMHLWKEKLSKHTSDRPPKFYIADTRGADTIDDVKSLVDEDEDTMVVKQYFSAFDQTSLLMSLRMRLVTELYICGCFTNVGVYATVVDAVQNGFEVNIVEDCVGWRREDKHVEAMRQMADVLGANGIESEELIAELGGKAPPDAEEPMFSGPGLEGIRPRESSPATGGASIRDNTPASTRVNRRSGHVDRYVTTKSMTPSRSSNEELPPALSDTISPPSTKTARLAQSRRGLARSMAEPNLKVSNPKVRKPRSSATANVVEASDDLGAGDSRILQNVLSSPLSKDAFEILRTEVEWKTMHHRGGEVPRLVAVQGEIEENGSIPIYRHPADESPPLLRFSPTVEKIRKEVEKAIQQPLNHALIQLYRGGDDNISEHSDKVALKFCLSWTGKG